VETIGERVEWTRPVWRVGEFVEPTDQVRVRFTVDDSPNNSLVEALIDDFTVERLVCSAAGDLNCDGSVSLNDINAFVLALSNPAGYAAMYPGCDRMLADINADGVVDFKDINAFVVLLSA
jgi:hypothetical protein